MKAISQIRRGRVWVILVGAVLLTAVVDFFRECEGAARSPDVALPAALEDLDFFFRTVESVHPQPLALISPEDYLGLKRRSKELLEEAANKGGTVPRSLLAVVVAEAAAAFGDGHTSCHLRPWLIPGSDQSKRMLPFHLAYECGVILIGDTVEGLGHLRRSKLLEINGAAVVEFIQPILDKVSGERTEGKINGFIHNQRTYCALIPLTDEAKISVTVLDDDGQKKTETLELLSLRDYDTRIPRSQRKKRENFHQLHHEGKTCYWQYNSFTYSWWEKLKIGALFRLLREKGVENLIIDLRFNGGGNSSAGDYILSHLTTNAYCMYSRVDIRLSEQLFKLGRRKELKELAGLTITRRIEPRRPEDRKSRFDGRVLLLTGPGTFSSAADFAAVVKDYEIGTIIGEETGGLRECFGDVLGFRLPNSGIPFGVSYKRFYAPVPRPDDGTRGTVPDAVVDEERLSDYSDSDDPVRAFALDYVLMNKSMSVAPEAEVTQRCLMEATRS